MPSVFSRFRRKLGSRARLSGRWLIAASVAVALALGALVADVMLDMRHTAYQQSRVASVNIISTVAADIARNIEIYDLSLQAVADNLKNPEINQISEEIRQLVLFDRAATAKHLGRIRVTDEKGQVKIDSVGIDVVNLDMSKRDFFVVHKDNPYVGLFIGDPFVTKAGNYSIGVSRRLSHPDGSFAGVVVGILRLSFFYDLFRSVTLGPDSAIGLSHMDGSLLMRKPFNIEDIGRNIGGSRMFSTATRVRSGTIETDAAIDGRRRLYTFRQVGTLPLMMTVGISIDEIYAEWNKQAWLIGFAAAVLAAATIGLALFSSGELRRRAQAEASLAILATTDGLTGVSNRRSFDEALQREWQRSLRQGTPIALLMIDADHFKAYNDRYGHQTGDKALAAIAGCIAAGTRAVVDTTARYGGEEFAVLLPATPLAEAAIVAERIRKSAEALHEFGQDGHLVPTVSVGVACRLPQPGVTPDELVAAADRALYAAKRNGRNCFECEGDTALAGGTVEQAA